MEDIERREVKEDDTSPSPIEVRNGGDVTSTRLSNVREKPFSPRKEDVLPIEPSAVKGNDINDSDGLTKPREKAFSPRNEGELCEKGHSLSKTGEMFDEVTSDDASSLPKTRETFDDATSDDACSLSKPLEPCDEATSDDASSTSKAGETCDEVSSDDADEPHEDDGEDTPADRLLKAKHELRNKMLLGWGSSVSMAVVAGLHMCADSWFNTQTYSGASSFYLAVFLSCFAFATYTDNVEALKPRSPPTDGAKELNFWKNATPQHYSWILSSLTAVLFPVMVASGVIQTEKSITTGLVWIAPSLILRLAIGMSAILHRFVSHRAFEPRNRLVQFALCWVGCMAGQGSPIFWGAMHNRHHKHCDTKLDPHSPQVYPFWYAWWGWTITESGNSEERYLKYLWSFPEIRFLHKFFYLPFYLEYAVVWWFFGFATMLYGCWLPSTLAAAFTLLFNVRSHQPALDELPSTTCKAFNLVDLGAWVVGESAHLDHHHDPKAFNRVTDQWFGFYDFPYYVVIKPLILLGLVTLPPKKCRDEPHKYENAIMVATLAGVGFIGFICSSVA